MESKQENLLQKPRSSSNAIDLERLDVSFLIMTHIKQSMILELNFSLKGSLSPDHHDPEKG